MLLLLTVAVTHYGYEPLCAIVAGWQNASWAVFYVLRGLEGAVLFSVIAYLSPKLWPVCLWGFAEESQTAICRAAAGIGQHAPARPWQGICGAETSWPLYMTGIVCAAILARKAQDARTRE